jgi:hypothetical protein
MKGTNAEFRFPDSAALYGADDLARASPKASIS